MKELFIVDGYNIIFASTELKALANDSLDHAREKLIDTMANYGKVRGYELVLVFDAMYTEEGAKSRKIGKDCEIIFTDKKKQQTAVLNGSSTNIGMNGGKSTSPHLMARNRIRFSAAVRTVYRHGNSLKM